jgi:hypothetical protein
MPRLRRLVWPDSPMSMAADQPLESVRKVHYMGILPM